MDADKLLAALPNGATVPTLAPTAEDHAAVDRGGGTTFAHLFDGALRTGRHGPGIAAVDQPVNPAERLGDRLAALLNTTRDKLPADLGQIGQELAFYMATDPILHRRFATAIAPPSPAPHEGASAPATPTTADDNVEDVRQRLLARGVSPALAAKLRTYQRPGRHRRGAPHATCAHAPAPPRL